MIRSLIALTTGVAIAGLLVGAGPASHSNAISGLIEGQFPGQNAQPLPNIDVQVESGSQEIRSTQSDNTGAFTFKLDASTSVFRLLIWDSGNRWWGRDVSHIPNDPAHANLQAFVLRPQTSKLSREETREQKGIIPWLRNHSPLSAGLMELHMGEFDRPGQPAETRIAGSGGSAYGDLVLAYQREHPDVALTEQASTEAHPASGHRIDFGTVGHRLSERELAVLAPIEQVPIGLEATVLIYHSRRLPAELRFSGPVLAKIFSWTDQVLERFRVAEDQSGFRSSRHANHRG